MCSFLDNQFAKYFQKYLKWDYDVYEWNEKLHYMPYISNWVRLWGINKNLKVDDQNCFKACFAPIFVAWHCVLWLIFSPNYDVGNLTWISSSFIARRWQVRIGQQFWPIKLSGYDLRHSNVDFRQRPKLGYENINMNEKHWISKTPILRYNLKEFLYGHLSYM